MAGAPRISPDSRDWRELRDWLAQAIEDAGAELERRGLGIPETEFLRGRIAALRDVLHLPEETPTPPPIGSDPYRT